MFCKCICRSFALTLRKQANYIVYIVYIKSRVADIIRSRWRHNWDLTALSFVICFVLTTPTIFSIYSSFPVPAQPSSIHNLLSDRVIANLSDNTGSRARALPIYINSRFAHFRVETHFSHHTQVQVQCLFRVVLYRHPAISPRARSTLSYQCAFAGSRKNCHKVRWHLWLVVLCCTQVIVYIYIYI